MTVLTYPGAESATVIVHTRIGSLELLVLERHAIWTWAGAWWWRQPVGRA